MSAWRKVTPKVLQTGHLSHDIRADGRSVECAVLHDVLGSHDSIHVRA